MNINDLPKYHELFLPTLKALDSLGGSASLDESDEAVVEILNLPDALIDIQYPSGNGAVLPDRLLWARSYLKSAGYLESGGRSVWVLTDEGREATRDGAPAIDLIDGEALCEKLKDLGLGVKKEMVEPITVLPKWFDDI